MRDSRQAFSSPAQSGLGVDNAGLSDAIEEYAVWIPDGMPAGALRDLHNGKVPITGRS
jgi:hypothetical protein